MDPQAAWERLLCAYADGDWDDLEDVAVALSNWLRKGGFPPVVIGDPALGLDFEGALAKAGCEFVLCVLRTRYGTLSDVPTCLGKENT